MGKAQDYQKHAVECRELAAVCPSEDSREHMLHAAESWDRLARRERDAEPDDSS